MQHLTAEETENLAERHWVGFDADPTRDQLYTVHLTPLGSSPEPQDPLDERCVGRSPMSYWGALEALAVKFPPKIALPATEADALQWLTRNGLRSG